MEPGDLVRCIDSGHVVYFSTADTMFGEFNAVTDMGTYRVTRLHTLGIVICRRDLVRLTELLVFWTTPPGLGWTNARAWERVDP